MTRSSLIHTATRRLRTVRSWIGIVRRRGRGRTSTIDDKMFRTLARIGLEPPFDAYTICERIITAAKDVLGYDIKMEPHPTHDGGVSGFVYKRGSQFIVLYVPSDNPLVELWSKLHELFHILCNHPIPDGYQLKAFVVRNEYDAEAESLTAATMRAALSGEIVAAVADFSPLTNLLRDEEDE